MPQSGSVLVVDAEATILDLLLEILTDAGYVAYSAPPGEALAMMLRYPPALLLLDIRPPSMDDVELIAQVRAAGLATTSIVVMTTAPRLLSETIVCLPKPFDLDDLFACVARYVQPIATEPALLALSAQ
jgi:CheY-like chemotaxis protein